MDAWDRMVGFARNRMASHAVAYASGLIISRVPPFLFMPLYATVLTPAELGLYVTAMIVIDLVQTVSGGGMVQALGRFFPMAKTPEERKRVLGTSLSAGMVGSALVCASAFLLYSVPPVRASLESFSAFDPLTFLLALGAGGFAGVNSLFIAYMRSDQRPYAFLKILSLGAAVEFAGSLFLVLTRRVDLDLILALECLRGAATAAGFLYASRGDASLRFHRETFRTLLRFGIWLVPVGLFVWITVCIDRFWLGQLAGLEWVGIYGLYTKFSTPAAILFQGYIISMDSRLFKTAPEEGMRLVERSLYRYLSLGGLLVCAAAVAFPVAVLLAIKGFGALPEDYLSGLKVYPLMLATTYVQYWVFHYAALLEFQFRPRRQLLYMGMAAAANAVLCPVFIIMGGRAGIDPLSCAAVSNLAATGILLAAQSRGSRLVPAGKPFWVVAAPTLLGLTALFAVLWRLA